MQPRLTLREPVRHYDNLKLSTLGLLLLRTYEYENVAQAHASDDKMLRLDAFGEQGKSTN